MKNRTSVSGHAAADLLERVSRAAYGEGFAGGLNPAQWAALRYFGCANRFSRTVSAFAEFQGTTRGTASQTVKALFAKTCVARERVAGDGRSFRVRSTVRGRALLKRDPFRDLARAAAALSAAQRSDLAASLDVVLARLRARRGRPRFGVCASCSHLRFDAWRGHPKGPHACGLLGEPLSDRETGEICVKYSAARLARA
ncbi:MAG: MarR family winged helix-turn-helix transcriptional regulator [Pseudomonadota bacterium]